MTERQRIELMIKKLRVDLNTSINFNEQTYIYSEIIRLKKILEELKWYYQF